LIDIKFKFNCANIQPESFRALNFTHNLWRPVQPINSRIELSCSRDLTKKASVWEQHQAMKLGWLSELPPLVLKYRMIIICFWMLMIIPGVFVVPVVMNHLAVTCEVQSGVQGADDLRLLEQAMPAVAEEVCTHISHPTISYESFISHATIACNARLRASFTSFFLYSLNTFAEQQLLQPAILFAPYFTHNFHILCS
jgi:hypothetical protein